MPKLSVNIERDNANAMCCESYFEPVHIKVCVCKQCKHVKNKRKNRVYKNKVKRWMNKKRRQDKLNGKIRVFYWA
jgi:hypothetical protein